MLFTPRMESLNRAVDDAENELRDAAGRLRNTVGPSYAAFARALVTPTRAPSVNHIVYGPGEGVSATLAESLRAAGAVVFATRNGYDGGAWQVEFLRQVVASVGTGAAAKVVAVSTCAPYDLLGAGDVGVPAIATFEFTVPALSAAAAAIYGETSVSGTVPVSVKAG